MKLLIILSLAALAWSKPSEQYEPAIQTQVISEGAWVTDTAWAGDKDNTDDKRFNLDIFKTTYDEDKEPSLPSTTAPPASVGNGWTWDR